MSGYDDRLSEVLPVLAEQAATIDLDATFPIDGLATLRRSGLLGLLVPTEWGGLGGDVADLVDVAGELAAECLSTALVWAMHGQQCDVLIHFADQPLQERLLPKIAAGEIYLGSVTTEPGKGGHLLTAIAALRDGEEGRLAVDRFGPVVTGGEHADGFLVTMRAAQDARDTAVTLVYADRDQLKLEIHGGWNTLGMRGTRSVPMHLSGEIPASQVVGTPGRFRVIAVESMAPLGHIGWAACWLGAARGALRQVVNLLRTKKGPSSVDMESDLVRERLARIRMDLEIVSAYLHRTVAEVTEARRDGRSLDLPSTQIHLNTLKVIAAEHTHLAIDRLVQLCGMGLGYNRDSAVPLERTLRDLRSASLNYANDRLLTATGTLTVMDRGVRLG